MIKIDSKILMIVSILISIILGLVWLGALILLLILIFNIALYYIQFIKNHFLKKAVRTLFLFSYLLSIVVCTKLLLFDIYKIPSSSMESMLCQGDVIVVNKLEYGPRLPRSPFDIPVANLAFYMNRDARSRIKETWWDYYKWGGTTKIKQGDVFVFNSSWDKDYIIIKRCVALPGDTLIIKKGEVYTNSIAYSSPETVKNNCSFRIKNRKLLYRIMDSLPIEGYLKYDYKKPNLGSAIFSNQQFEFLEKRNCIDSLNKNLDVYDPNQELLKTPTSKWTLDDMGPIIIPKMGMEIKLNPENYMLYESVINQCEKTRLSEKNGSYFINEEKIVSYKFKLNYYFMMGDNRKGTMDSRVWGFVPEFNIIGKVRWILFSNKNDEFQWDRFFKML